MNDEILNKRIINYRKVDNDPLLFRENLNLTLRKEKLYEEIMRKRLTLNNIYISGLNFKVSEESKKLIGLSSNLNIPLLIKWLYDHDLNYKFFALHILYESCSLEKPPDEIFNEIIFTILLAELSNTTYEKAKSVILSIISAMSYSSSKLCLMLFDLNHLITLYEFSFSSNKEDIHSVLLIMGNLLIEDKEYFIINNIPLILRIKQILIERKSLKKIIDDILWIISILLSKFNNDRLVLLIDFIPTIKEIFFDNQYDLQRIIEIFNILVRNQITINEFLDKEFVRSIFNKIKNNSLDIKIRMKCTRILVNIFAEDDNKIQNLFEDDYIDIINSLFIQNNNQFWNGSRYLIDNMTPEDKNFIKNILSLINNLIAGPLRFINFVYNMEIYVSVLRLFEFDEFEISFFILNTFIAGECQCILKLIDRQEFFPIVKRLIDEKSSNINEGLKIVQYLIKFCSLDSSSDFDQMMKRELDDEILERIHELCYYKDQSISQLSLDILKELGL